MAKTDVKVTDPGGDSAGDLSGARLPASDGGADQSTAAATAAAEVREFPVTLDEFCSRLSATDRRVELIAAFHHDETAAGRLSDVEGKFQARYEAFAKRPV